MIDYLMYALARLQKKSAISAIRNSKIHRTSVVEAGSQVVDTTMGKHSFCGYECALLNVEIGSFCSIADNVYIGGSQHPLQFVSTSPVFLAHRDSVKTKFSRHDYTCMPRTEIGSDVWIGFGAKIKAGIKVSHGSVIGMGSVVTKDVPPYSIVAGNPAVVIRRRFSDRICDKLLDSLWWEFSDEDLLKIGPYINDPEAFIGVIDTL